MKLAPQQQTVFDYVAANPHCTIEQIRQATKIRKPCMRISEINYQWREENGYPHSEKKEIISTQGYNKYREAFKAIAIT